MARILLCNVYFELCTFLVNYALFALLRELCSFSIYIKTPHQFNLTINDSVLSIKHLHTSYQYNDTMLVFNTISALLRVLHYFTLLGEVCSFALLRVLHYFTLLGEVCNLIVLSFALFSRLDPDWLALFRGSVQFRTFHRVSVQSVNDYAAEGYPHDMPRVTPRISRIRLRSRPTDNYTLHYFSVQTLHFPCFALFSLLDRSGS
jgi:hypothetical protein